MEQAHHIRLSGHAEAILLTAAARDALLRYLADARTALQSDPDGDETVRDVEASLGDQLQRLVSDSAQPVDVEQMSQLLSDVGVVQSEERETSHVVAGPQGAAPRGPFWCRINEGKWFGGLCLGIAARGEFNPDWTRTVVFFLLLLTGGLVGFVYLALLLVVPRVESVEEYRRLRDAPPLIK